MLSVRQLDSGGERIGDFQCSEMSLYALKRLRAEAGEEIARRRVRKKPKAPYLYKGFRQDELDLFFSFVESRRYRLLFMLMAFAGLRVGEAVRVRVGDVDFLGGRLRVVNRKAGGVDLLPLHPRLYGALEEFCCDRVDYLFPSPCEGRRFLSEKSVRSMFRRVCGRAGLDMVYAERDGVGRQGGRLFRLSTHSLRHYFVTRVYNSSGSLKVAQRLARHRDMGTTQAYIHVGEEELLEATLNAF